MTHRFTEDDERGFILLPKGKYPAKVTKKYQAEKPDKEGRTFYKVEFTLISGDFKGIPLTLSVSEYWMRHLLIHFMRSVGMMDTMVVDPFFRGNPQDSASFNIHVILENMLDCMVLLDVGHSVSKNDGKTYHGVNDILPLKLKDGSPVEQPKWIEIPPTQQAQDDVVLDPDTDLEEDENFFVD